MSISEWPWSRIRSGTTKRFTRLLLARLLRPAVIVDLQRIGSAEDARLIPSGALQPGDVCFCVGVGNNVTFDLDLVDQGCRVYAYDPTPTSIEYMAALEYDRDALKFFPVGVWSSDRSVTFHSAANSSANWSALDVHSTDETFEADCRRLETLMQASGHDSLALLKLDVEGAWEAILQDMLTSRIAPKILAVEFDSPTSVRRVRRMVRRLADEGGLLLAHFTGEDFVFVRSDIARHLAAHTAGP